MKLLHKIAWILVIIGALNWGLVGLFEFDLVAKLFADGFGTLSGLSRVVYTLVGISGLIGLFGKKCCKTCKPEGGDMSSNPDSGE